MGFVKRKGTKATKTLPSDFAEIQQVYLSKEKKFIRNHAIPDSLVLNLDQTGCLMVPGGTGQWKSRAPTRSPLQVSMTGARWRSSWWQQRLVGCSPRNSSTQGRRNAVCRKALSFRLDGTSRLPSTIRAPGTPLCATWRRSWYRTSTASAPSLLVRSAGPDPVWFLHSAQGQRVLPTSPGERDLLHLCSCCVYRQTAAPRPDSKPRVQGETQVSISPMVQWPGRDPVGRHRERHCG